MKPIEELKTEHEGILLMLDILEKMSERIEAGENVPADHLKQVLDFLQVFADKCHHGKEEGILFAAMEKAGVPKKDGPLGVMLSEHGRGRHFIADMKDLLKSYEKGESGALAVFTTPALQYVNLLRSHIWKENNVLFPLAEKAVPAQELNLMGEQFERFEKDEIGQGTHEAFHEMLDRLSNIYLETN
jgi:hemerythrin-like domain-containing protein